MKMEKPFKEMMYRLLGGRKVQTFKPCQGKLPLRKYINIWPSASRSSLLLCSEGEEKQQLLCYTDGRNRYIFAVK